jgi:hypothetical protein
MMGTEHYQELLASVSNLPRVGIRFQERYFSEPILLGCRRLPIFGGVYAVLVSDPTWEPRHYRPVYFGEAADLAGAVWGSHEKYADWCAMAGAGERVYVSYHLMSGNAGERAVFLASLIREYRPVCNSADSSEASGRFE